MAQKIKIAKIEVKEGDNDKGHWVNYIITGEDKAKVSIFEPNNAGLKPSELGVGDVIEAEIELKGKFANLKSFEVIEHGSPISKPNLKPDTGRTESPEVEKRISIEAQNAYTGVITLLANKIIDLKDPLAQTAVNYATSKLGKWASEEPEPKKPGVASEAKPTAEELNETLKLIVSSKKMTSVEVTKLLKELGGVGATKLAMIESLSDGAQLHLATRIKPLVPSRLVQEAVRLGAEIVSKS